MAHKTKEKVKIYKKKQQIPESKIIEDLQSKYNDVSLTFDFNHNVSSLV